MSNRRQRILTVSILALAFAADAGAACDSPEFRAFDFWIGEWRVTAADGRVAGINRIESKHGGCVLRERYVTGRGYSGESLNMYDAGRKLWHQTWVDSSGLLLLIEGGIRDGSMVMEGETRGTDAAGKVTKHRITWTPNADGSVRQHWQSTNDKGEWTTVFDGRYTKQ